MAKEKVGEYGKRKQTREEMKLLHAP